MILRNWKMLILKLILKQVSTNNSHGSILHYMIFCIYLPCCDHWLVSWFPCNNFPQNCAPNIAFHSGVHEGIFHDKAWLNIYTSTNFHHRFITGWICLLWIIFHCIRCCRSFVCSCHIAIGTDKSLHDILHDSKFLNLLWPSKAT